MLRARAVTTVRIIVAGMLIVLLAACSGSPPGELMPADRLPAGWPAEVPAHDGELEYSHSDDFTWYALIVITGENQFREARRQMLAAGFQEESTRKGSGAPDALYVQFRGHGRGVGLAYSGEVAGEHKLLYAVEKAVSSHASGFRRQGAAFPRPPARHPRERTHPLVPLRHRRDGSMPRAPSRKGTGHERGSRDPGGRPRREHPCSRGAR